MRTLLVEVGRGRRGGAVFCLLAVIGLSGCTATCGRGGRVSRSATGVQPRPAESTRSPAKDQKQLGSVEAQEEADEERLREGWLKALAAYRAPSCDVAIARIEGLLKRGQGRWEERTETGSLPGNLAGLLSEAELWGSQSESACADSPRRPRFDALRLLMDTIWQYPTRVSKTELEQRLSVLGD